jgi:adenylate cyclase class IV
MPANVEIKARLADPDATRRLVEAICDGPPAVLRQRDTFFHCPRGRLKLREMTAGDTAAGQAELIFYERDDVAAARQSDYEIAPVSAPTALEILLDRALGAATVVEKTRLLFHVGQTRVHLDTVVGLGDFLELEVVLRPDQSAAEGRAIATDLMQRLGIAPHDLVDTAYADMLAGPSTGA